MADTYVGLKGKKYTVITPAIGSGGEGSVYKIAGDPDSVLKVFIENKRTETRHRKLLAMIDSNLPQNAMQQITWPRDVVYVNNSFVGYVMPYVDNNENLNVIYSDKYDCTLFEKIIIAKNLCAAVNAIHNAGQVCGDLNPLNIAVNPKSAKVTLLDTDSYHILDKNTLRTYRCEVGLPEYLAREIQEKIRGSYNLQTAPLPTFTKETDLFALAVHIFALLMNGCHPFACAKDGTNNIGPLSTSQSSVTLPQPIENIEKGFFPFYDQKTGITTPKYAPSFSSLPPYIQTLFVTAFVDGNINPNKRPDTVEWYNALTTYQNDLIECKTNNKHLYYSKLKKCPWCQLNEELKKHAIAIKNNINVVNTVPQYNTIYAPPPPSATNVYSQSAQTFVQPVVPKTYTGIFASSGMFWFLTLAITLGTQAVVHTLYGEQIIKAIFGSGLGNGFDFLIGPWGFVICGFLGSILYNVYLSKDGQEYGYSTHHYILSILTSFFCSLGYILVVMLLAVVMIIIGVIIGVAILFGLVSGS